jgi:hypothetical protein
MQINLGAQLRDSHSHAPTHRPTSHSQGLSPSPPLSTPLQFAVLSKNGKVLCKYRVKLHVCKDVEEEKKIRPPGNWVAFKSLRGASL